MNREFRINKHLTLKLEEGKTNIYVNDKLFNQCKFLLLEISVKEMTSLDEIRSIDEAVEELDGSLEHQKTRIPPEVEFWGHSSNLQVWHENHYDTRLLANNLAFPLLKKLAEAGDPLAKIVFKEEIAKRLSSGEKKIIDYLIQEGYTDCLSHEEFLYSMLDSKEFEVLKELEQKFKTKIIFNYETAENQSGFKVKNKHVVYLSLSSRKIKTIPEEIGDLSYLQYIDLSYNEIERIPDSVGKLKELRSLNLDKNKIEHLPETLEELKYLESLSLVDNKIRSLPDSIGKLENLKELILAINYIKILPESMGNLKLLEILHLGSNYIKEIPSSLGNLSSLAKLNLEYNKLEQLPDSIGNLCNLRHLLLEHNDLSEIPDSMGNLNSLEYVHLNDNKINSIPSSVGKLGNLKYLNLKNNKIKRKEDLPREILRDGLTIYI